MAEMDEWISEFDTPTSDETEWTAANIQEALPGLVSPLSWSLISPLLNYAFARPAQRMGSYKPPRDPYVANFYGRAYLNATALREGTKSMPGGSPEAIDEQYLGRQRDASAPAWKPTFADQRQRLKVAPRMAWLMLRAGKELEAIERQVRELDARDSATDLSTLSPAELVASLTGGMEVGREVGALHIGTSGGASATFETLGKMTRDWLGDETGSLQATLVTGLAEVESAKPSKALWDLSRYATQSEEVSKALGPHSPAASPPGGEGERGGAEALAQLRRSESAEAKRFVQAYDAFIERFGHRSVLEGELSAPLWEEDPGAVFALLRNLRDTGTEASPYLTEVRQRDLRELETARALASLPAPKRAIFKQALALAQSYVARREQTKSMLVKGTQRARKIVQELARRLVADGAIEKSEDVFFLTLEELEAAVQPSGRSSAAAEGSTVPNLRDKVALRRAEMERNRGVLLPESFVGRPRPIAVETAAQAVTSLKGIPVSPGVVSGVARVIMDPRVDGHLEQGEILVAPVTDAGWTPLFMTAAAVVVDIGGPLSHGATVARELGLPAVVNVKQGTKVIKSGQRITVDGGRGVVTWE